jgi:hypothetical protein
MRVLKPLRQRLTAGMELANSPRYESSLASPGSPAQAVLMKHELISLQEVRKEAMSRKRSDDARSDAQAGGKQAKRGKCCMVGKGRTVAGSEMTTYKCMQCGGKAGAFFHAFCFARRHKCSLH